MPNFRIDYPADKPNAGYAVLVAGFSVWEDMTTGWWCDAVDETHAAACQAWLNDYDDEGMSRQRAKLRVKDEASRRITARWPITVQLNALAEAGAITDARSRGIPLGAAVEARAAELRAMSATINAIRAASNAIEASLDGITDVYELDAFNPAASDLWPETP